MKKIAVRINYYDLFSFLNSSPLCENSSDQEKFELFCIVLKCFFSDEQYEYNINNKLFKKIGHYVPNKQLFIDLITQISTIIVNITKEYLPRFKSYDCNCSMNHDDVHVFSNYHVILYFTIEQFLNFSDEKTAPF